MSFLQASWHSWTISMANFLDLASPEKAKTFWKDKKVNISNQDSLRRKVKGTEGATHLGLAVGDFVDSEPLVGSSDESREVSLDVLNVVELGGEGVVDVDDDDLPVGLSLVEEGPEDGARKGEHPVSSRARYKRLSCREKTHMIPRTLTCLTCPT